MINQISLEVIYVVCDYYGCPRYSFDLSPSGYTNKQSGSPSTYGKIVIPIDPITVLMNPNMLTQQEIESLGWPTALATTMALLRQQHG